MKAKRSIIRFILPFLIIIVGIIILAALTMSRRKPEKQSVGFPGVLVETVKAEKIPRKVVVRGHGVAKPLKEISLAAQAPGKVEWVHPDFLAGGEFKKGEILIRIEQEDYRLAVEQAKAQVAQAEYSLALAEANVNVARKEWESMREAQKNLELPGYDANEEPDALVLRQPQLKQAQAALESAQAALQAAELRLKRTEIEAPFDCRIRKESVDPGQFINAGSPIAALFSTDIAEIEVGLPLSESIWLEIPGADAEVNLDVNGETFSWFGKVDRSLGVIDERERLATVVVQVKEPYKIKNGSKLPLSIGSFVEVEIQGPRLTDIYPLPRRALRDNSTLWIAVQDSILEIRNVKVKRLTPNEVFIVSGLKEGEMVITSSISGAAPGLKVRSMKIIKKDSGL